ncbi:uncharacterized protein A1O9_02956 [Exophiala aquamarina CBS 119918]|uniref:Neutral metalloproteinase n=1 Tax=Exophiala aquamarina CBS 119918 TaxID=1182545 RepID=A0A072Q0I3_9EURO|nr:uncharacterized protein A1O9_02956 [Exophiala aquamarina CBS 119918]KEF61390.1 hypothetical protein A1O9_02956 [Exophiala aquamarina CBS 119918]
MTLVTHAGHALQATPVSGSLLTAKRKSKERFGIAFGEFEIYDAANDKKIPGTFRADEESFRPTNDIQIDVLYHWLRKIHTFFLNAFSFKFFDGKGNSIQVSIHYGVKCMNAYWKNGTVVLGDGDSFGLYDFWTADDIIAHEITHGIIAHTSGLKNRDETGALNEHLADVFAIFYKQYQQSRDSDAATSTWIVGEKLFVGSQLDRPKPTPAPAGFPKNISYIIHGNENSPSGCYVVTDPNRPFSQHWHKPHLRNFEEPGTSNPPQPYHWSDRKTVAYDRGGVHQNSGIPNFAFYRAAIEARGPAWSGVGQVWFRAMLDPNLDADCTFNMFAALTLQHAAEFDTKLIEPICKGWSKVGVALKS